MKRTDLSAFSALLSQIAGMYKRGDPLTVEVIDEYFEALKDLSIEKLRGAYGEMKKFRRDSWFPVPGDIRSFVPSEIPYHNTYRLPEGKFEPHPAFAKKMFDLFLKRSKGEITQAELEKQVKKLTGGGTT